jgi:beta-galactosidase/beta-glucuronidase
MLLSVLMILLGVGAEVTAQTSQTQTRYLSGMGKDDGVLWDFFCTSGRKSGVWTKIPVPSCWEQQGFGAYNYGRNRISETNPLANEQGRYRLQFAVPASWKGRVVRLVFDGSMTDTEVRINGQSAGPIHQGSFYRFKYDVTNLLKFGEQNLLEVTVSKVSANDSVNRAERFNVDYWVFGGIFRPVYLEALPSQFIDWTAINARADGSFVLDAHLAGNTPSATVSAQLLDDSGRPIGPPFTAKVSPITDAAPQTVRLETKIAQPRLWTAETPNLYRVRLTLLVNGRPLHTVTERFGFRTFEVRAGDGLYLNGQKIILKGANRHSFWPESGRTLSRQISYDDVKLIKEMNMNAVRMSHYPPDAHFLEACDELGLYVLDELGGWQRSYDTPTGQRLIGEIVRRDVNHPSILFWDNGNEGGWNREVDVEFGRWDPQNRTVLHPWELFNHVNTGHYKKYPDSEKILSGSELYLPTEFMHGLYDGGAGAGLADYWELMRKSKLGAGGFIWALVDECVARTDQNGRLDCAGNQAPDGIVGPHREKEGSFNTVREIWSPVQIVDATKPARGYPESFRLENRYDFTNLAQCSFVWQLATFPSADDPKSGHTVIASGSVKGPSITPHGAGELKLQLPASWQQSSVLYLTARDPAGHALWKWSWTQDFKSADAYAADGKLETTDEANLLIVKTAAFELRFNKQNGRLAEVRRGGQTVPFGDGPRFVAFRRDDRKYLNIAGESSLTNFATRKEGVTLVIEATYKGPLHQVRWRVAPYGSVRLEYEYAFDGVVDLMGVNFEFPERHVKGIRWLGMGPYRVWQNRLQGTRLDVWENSYNDSTPGESWSYPEFKGYFRDWRWANFDTTDGRILLETDGRESFLGIYRPKDGKDGLLDLPNLGISFLDVIPAMRNKFHTTDEIGPQSQAKQVSGIKRGTIHFYFGDR